MRLTFLLAALACLAAMTVRPEPTALTAPEYRDLSVEPPRESPPPVIRVAIDVPLASMADVVSGVRAWERATRGWRQWDLAAPHEAHLTIVEGSVGDCPGIAVAIACAGEIGGLERRDRPHGRITLVRGRHEVYGTQLVVMHEIGHTLGLTHLDGTLMQHGLDEKMQVADWHCPDPVTLVRLTWHVGAELSCE